MKLKLNSPSAQTHTIYIGHIPVTYGQPRVRVSLFPTIALWLTDCKIVKWIVIVLNLIPFSFLLYTFSSSTLQHCVGMPFTLGSDLYLALRFLPLGSFSSWKRTNQPFHLYRRPHSEGQACEMKTVYTCIRFALHVLQTHRIASLWSPGRRAHKLANGASYYAFSKAANSGRGSLFEQLLYKCN